MARGRMTAAALALAAGSAAAESPIKNVVVVMMENRAFDHMLGHLALTDPRIDGIGPNTCQPVNTSDPTGDKVCVAFDAVDGGPVDPYHDFDSITFQVFGTADPAPGAAPRMDGFLENNAKQGKAAVPFVMSAFNDTNLPVLSTLAREFAVVDHWFAQPTPTNPNREFMMSGTSHGYVNNSFPDEGFPQQTHFQFLQAHGKSWKCLFNDDPWMVPAFADLRTASALKNVVEMPQFYADLRDGTLANFTLIQPRMATSATGPSNWQHPDNSVSAGEIFLNDIYTALRSSPYWQDTLLVITYDEHGGFPDHHPSPTTGIPSPDGIVSDNGFAFDRLGVRIPTVLVSPWVARGTVVNAPTGPQLTTPTTQWDHTAIIASTNRLFGIAENLTARDAWAATFNDLIDGSAGFRPDCPASMPLPPPPSPATLAAEAARALNDHHLDSLNLLCHLVAGEPGAVAAGGLHAVCAGHPGRAAYAAALAAETGARVADEAAEPWELAGAYRHLHAPAARLLVQRHFGDISRHMWAAWKAAVIAREAQQQQQTQ